MIDSSECEGSNHRTEHPSVTAEEEPISQTAHSIEQNDELTENPQRCTQASVHPEPPRIDEFFRYFLLKNNFKRTMKAFQKEWFEFMEQKNSELNRTLQMPSVYMQNEALVGELNRLKIKYTTVQHRTEEQEDRYKNLKNENDYYIIKYKRLLREKKQLLRDIRKLRNHHVEQEFLTQQVKHQYESALRDKTLSEIEKEKLNKQLSTLLKAEGSKDVKDSNPPIQEEKELGQTGSSIRGSGICELPKDSGVNPMLDKLTIPSSYTTRNYRKILHTVDGHHQTTTGLAMYSLKALLCSTGDDNQWALWDPETLSPLLRKKVGDSWIAGADFHPNQQVLATANGDGNLQIWRFELDWDAIGVLRDNHQTTQEVDSKAWHQATLSHHVGPAWSLSWHWDGKFLASCGIDGSICVWDSTAAKPILRTPSSRRRVCRMVLRHHKGSINSVRFVPFGNVLISASSDATVTLTDLRTGLCEHRLTGHKHAVNDALINQQGTHIASADSSGVVRLWDVRRITDFHHQNEQEAPQGQVNSFNLTKGSTVRINKLAFELPGERVIAAGSDGTVHLIALQTSEISSFHGHQDEIQSMVLDLASNKLYTGGSDGKIIAWS